MSIVTVIEWMRDILTDEATGLNAQLLQLPRPDDVPPPDLVDFANEIDDDWVGRDILPRAELLDERKDARPLVLIRMLPDPQGFSVPVLPEYAATDPSIYPVALIYVTRFVVREHSTATLSSVRRNARQTIRTALRVIAQQFADAHSVIGRDGCELSLPSTGCVLNSQFLEPVDDLVLDTLVAPIRVHDPWALGL